MTRKILLFLFLIFPETLIAENYCVVSDTVSQGAYRSLRCFDCKTKYLGGVAGGFLCEKMISGVYVGTKCDSDGNCGLDGGTGELEGDVNAFGGRCSTADNRARCCPTNFGFAEIDEFFCNEMNTELEKQRFDCSKVELPKPECRRGEINPNLTWCENITRCDPDRGIYTVKLETRCGGTLLGDKCTCLSNGVQDCPSGVGPVRILE